MIKAVIFDMDGLMFDTEIMFKKQFGEKLAQKGIEQVPLEVIESMIGCDSSRVKMYEEQYPGITQAMEECQKERIDYFFHFFPEPGSANKKGLKELIAYLDKESTPYAIASSSRREDIEKFLAHAGFPLSPLCIVSGKEGFPSKPDPAIFLEAARRLGEKIEDCLVLEDSKNGIIAAKRAGAPSIFIQDQIVPDEEMESFIQERKEDLSQVIEIFQEKR